MEHICAELAQEVNTRIAVHKMVEKVETILKEETTLNEQERNVLMIQIQQADDIESKVRQLFSLRLRALWLRIMKGGPLNNNGPGCIPDDFKFLRAWKQIIPCIEKAAKNLGRIATVKPRCAHANVQPAHASGGACRLQRAYFCGCGGLNVELLWVRLSQSLSVSLCLSMSNNLDNES